MVQYHFCTLHVYTTEHRFSRGTTLAPNGFSFTYAVIPAHTPLYHARKTSETPNSPEWFAFDYQMSLGKSYNMLLVGILKLTVHFRNQAYKLGRDILTNIHE
jgi:hypothetical protein